MTLKLRFGDVQYLSSCHQKTKTKTAQTESQNDISSFPVLSDGQSDYLHSVPDTLTSAPNKD